MTKSLTKKEIYKMWKDGQEEIAQIKKRIKNVRVILGTVMNNATDKISAFTGGTIPREDIRNELFKGDRNDKK